MRICVFILLAAWGTLLTGQDLQEATAKMQTGDQEGALKITQAVIAKDSDQALPRAMLTEVLLNLERIDEADAAASAGITRAPNASSLHSALGDVYFFGFVSL